jgi:hypothetical protein
MSSCAICIEKYNLSNHKKINCAYCDLEACRSCCQTYILDQRTAKCMNNDCDKTWSRKFLVQNFTKKFINYDWKQNLENVYFDKEKALLPATQGIVEQMMENERTVREINEIERQIRELYNQRAELQNKLHTGDNHRSTQERKQFVRACPDEHCRGFLSTQWKCGLCDKWTCPECHVVKGTDPNAEHTCDPNDLETAKLLDKDTKSCPKCATGIFKIEGCDQMWCTQCHTAFSWRTGRIETNIHNPHYYEWQRRNNNGVAPRNVGDFQCGRELNHWSIRDIERQLRNAYRENDTDASPRTFDEFTPVTDEIMEMIEIKLRSTIHLHRVQMPTYEVNHVEDNQLLRIMYLRNTISEAEFKNRIQRNNKQHHKKREIGEVIHLFVQSVTDIAFRLRAYLHDKALVKQTEQTQQTQQTYQTQDQKEIKEACDGFLTEITTLCVYTDECFDDIALSYGCKRRRIHLYEYGERYRDVLITI